MRANKTSFFYRILLTLILVLLLLGSASIIQTRVLMNNLFAEQQEKRGISIANMLAARAANLILVHNFYDLHELVKDTEKSNDDVRYIFVAGQDGELLAHTFADGFPRDLQKLSVPKQKFSFHIAELEAEDGRIRDIAVPIFDGRLGVVHVGLDDTSLRAVLGRTINQIAMDTVIAMLLGIGITTFLAKRLVRPIDELVRVTSAIRTGDLTQRVSLASKDELGQLATTFNAMADYLQQTMTELKQKEEARTHLLQKVISAQEEERKRIARELHDETGQTLASLTMGLKFLTESCPINSRECNLDEMRAVIKRTIQSLHRLAVELRPSVLDDMGLIAAVEKYVADFKGNYQIDLDLHVVWTCSQRLPHEVEVTVYRIIQEALNNVSKYAAAQNVSVIITCDARGLEVIIEDDGIGFNVQNSLQENIAGNKLGLYGMYERAMLVGGTLTIESTSGHGTTVFLRIPRQQEGYYGNQSIDS